MPQGAICTNVNECESNPCGPFSLCVDTIGSYYCKCQSGFVGTPPRVPCKEPCADVKCGKHAYCKAGEQEAYCYCEDGWTFNPSDISLGCIGKTFW